MDIAIVKGSVKKQVLAETYIKKSKEVLVCPCCGSEVIFKSGNVNKPHFAHKTKKDCEYSDKSKTTNSMSEFHRKWQSYFYHNRECTYEKNQLEVKISNNIADVVYNGNQVIEIQHSRIAFDKVLERTQNYENFMNGKPLLWIIDKNNGLNHTHFPPDNIVIEIDDEKTEGRYKTYYKNEGFHLFYNGVGDYQIDNILEKLLFKIEEQRFFKEVFGKYFIYYSYKKEYKFKYGSIELNQLIKLLEDNKDKLSEYYYNICFENIQLASLQIFEIEQSIFLEEVFAKYFDCYGIYKYGFKELSEIVILLRENKDKLTDYNYDECLQKIERAFSDVKDKVFKYLKK